MTERAPKRNRALQASKVVAVCLVSTALGLGVAELAVGAARGFAWPYLNIYVADDAYGVRLEPETSTRTRTREGNITRIVTDDLGFRGPASAVPAHPRSSTVVVLGDSQSFGYGVDVEQTFARLLAGQRPADIANPQAFPPRVFNLSVPTWGPAEGARILDELGPGLEPDVVVFVANAANDWVEAPVANHRRTSAKDGWAVRRRPQAAAPSTFPGRRWLMSRSHLVFLVREGMALASGTPGLTARGPLTVATQPGRYRPRRGRTPGSDRMRAFRSILTPHIEKVTATCANLGCEVVVALLPVDVQVDSEAWGKYPESSRPLRRQRSSIRHSRNFRSQAGAPRAATTQPDWSGLDDLLDELAQDMADRSVTTVDLRGALRQASPGAFLDDDPHLSAKGHQVVAHALAPVLTRRTNKTAVFVPGGHR